LRALTGLIVITMMYWAQLQTSEGVFSATVIAAFVLLMFSVTDALIPVSDAVEEVPTYADSLMRMDQIEQLGDEVIHPSKYHGGHEQQLTISLENISYQYDVSNAPTIDGLSLTVEQGKKIAILGKSGTGKSTLLK